MGPMIRAASLREFVPLVEELGGDPDELLREFGMSRETVASDDELVPITAHNRMLDLAATTLSCPDLGLRLATMQDVSILGPLAPAVESSAMASKAVDGAGEVGPPGVVDDVRVALDARAPSGSASAPRPPGGPRGWRPGRTPRVPSPAPAPTR